MSDEMLGIIKGIILVISLITFTIFICLRLIDNNYVYFIDYFQGENKYEIKISDDFDINVEISVICHDEKCSGNYNHKIINKVDLSKDDVKEVIKEFKLQKNIKLETNEDKINEKQKKLITKIIR